MANIILATFGVTSEKELDLIQRPIVYQSAKRFSLSKKEPSQLPGSSEEIPRDLTKKVEEIQGKFLLTQYRRKYRNINIYSRDAVTVDGLNRLCTLKYDKEEAALYLIEAGNRRNSGYSGLYRELSERLEEAGLERKEGGFLIRRTRMDSFVGIVNQLIRDKENGLLELVPVDELDVMTFGGGEGHGTPYYYYKAYWKRKSLPQSVPALPAEAVQEEKLEGDPLFQKIEQAIRAYAEYSLANNDMETSKKIQRRVEELREKIDKLGQLNQAKMEALTRLKEI